MRHDDVAIRRYLHGEPGKRPGVQGSCYPASQLAAKVLPAAVVTASSLIANTRTDRWGHGLLRSVRVWMPLVPQLGRLASPPARDSVMPGVEPAPHVHGCVGSSVPRHAPLVIPGRCSIIPPHGRLGLGVRAGFIGHGSCFRQASLAAVPTTSDGRVSTFS